MTPTPQPTPCIETTNPRNRRGYGTCHVVLFGRLIQFTHVRAWVEANGPVPDGLFVCHHCDNPPCINVDHLWVGTHAENMADMTAKGRHRSQQKEVCPKCGGEFSTRTGREARECVPCENERNRIRSRERYQDPEVRERARAYSRKRYQDPEFRERAKEYARRAYWEKKAAREQAEA